MVVDDIIVDDIIVHDIIVDDIIVDDIIVHDIIVRYCKNNRYSLFLFEYVHTAVGSQNGSKVY